MQNSTRVSSGMFKNNKIILDLPPPMRLFNCETIAITVCGLRFFAASILSDVGDLSIHQETVSYSPFIILLHYKKPVALLNF